MSYKDISAIILAAGCSERLGRPKQLIQWQGYTLLNSCIKKVKQSGIIDITVVLGAYYQEIIKTINYNNLRIAINPLWPTGKASSIRAGLESMNDDTAMVLILVSDQPFLSEELINKIIDTENIVGGDIFIPITENGRRCNPVLFNGKTFNLLKMLDGDQGGKQIFNKFRTIEIPWDDDRISLDIDTISDLEILL